MANGLGTGTGSAKLALTIDAVLNSIANVSRPSLATEAATKAYVDKVTTTLAQSEEQGSKLRHQTANYLATDATNK